MMKILMRPDKSQFKNRVFRFNSPGQKTWDTTPYKMVGFKYVDIFMVGGAGGRSGTAGDNGLFAYSSGGGGACSTRIQNISLQSLPTKVPLYVAAAGAWGANRGRNPGTDKTRAPSGANGETSTFNNTWSAGGGYGALGGYANTWPQYGYGQGGNGGGGTAVNPANSQPAHGGWNEAAGTGQGGQGGTGGVLPEQSGYAYTAAWAGGWGCWPSSYNMSGEPIIGGRHGGGGAGANIVNFAGDGQGNEWYGTGSYAPQSNGCVVVKIH